MGSISGKILIKNSAHIKLYSKQKENPHPPTPSAPRLCSVISGTGNLTATTPASCCREEGGGAPTALSAGRYFEGKVKVPPGSSALLLPPPPSPRCYSIRRRRNEFGVDVHAGAAVKRYKISTRSAASC